MAGVDAITRALTLPLKLQIQGSQGGTVLRCARRTALENAKRVQLRARRPLATRIGAKSYDINRLTSLCAAKRQVHALTDGLRAR